jgi:hypothetical protein
LENTDENCEMIWKIWKKCEMIWKIWMKCEKISIIQKKGKLNSEKDMENVEEK